MTKHKTDDYKNSAVKYYLNNENGDGYNKTCKIFGCKKSTLRDWIYKYNIESKDFQFTEDGKYIRTHSYSFILT